MSQRRWSAGSTLDGRDSFALLDAFVDAAGSETKFVIDLVIRHGDQVWVLDTKYKAPEQAATDDIAQIVAYAESMGTDEEILVYPRGLSRANLYKVGATTVRALAFDLDGDLQAAGDKFLAELL
ncbi:hypothetical protein [Caldilinea sp.]|uniref:5-methylcytosine restriction system specificity protein McrC n=1 Tax=Caldilinea sp. TaxID=2293560 RepID=UPI002BEA19E5|nr:hypothetical protein [Anaerolineales bacterium]HQY92432.1 hypothetical protein [Caldilinea sp.]HRA65080.1 hypothetical protein [Caldilinea sp.]